jgi:hypothetical protein
MIEACVAQTDFERLYDHYFPRDSEYPQTIQRRYFDRVLFKPPPKRFDDDRTRHLYGAFHGNAAAAHRFLQSSDRDISGEPGMSWVYDCVLLLIRLGDTRFSELLAREDAKTRTSVGQAIDPLIHWEQHSFPKTRSLYSYRYVRGER